MAKAPRAEDRQVRLRPAGDLWNLRSLWTTANWRTATTNQVAWSSSLSQAKPQASPADQASVVGVVGVGVAEAGPTQAERTTVLQ
jgi:hypothetical protein